MKGGEMKLIIAIIQSEDARQLMEALVKEGYEATRISTMGGFLRRGNVTILTAVDASKVDTVLRLIKENCHRRIKHVHPLVPMIETTEGHIANAVPIEVGGATIFVLDLECFEKL
jgi:uncharacterized protein YaaQ